MSGSGNITVWINSPGGDCVAAAQIYNMLMDYKGDVTVKIDGIAASAASVIAMAGTKVLMSPTALMMIHNPLTVAIGDSEEMQKAIDIYRITKPLNGIVTIYGQHISYDLANVPVLPFSTESRSPQLILSQLLAGDTRFTGWTDYSDAKAFSVAQPKGVRACLGGTEGSMLSKWYGEFEWDNFTVKFHSHRGQKTGVVIEYKMHPVWF